MAEATVPEDEKQILEIIRRPDGPGVKRLNLGIQSFLKRWFMETLENEVKGLLHAEAWDLQAKVVACSRIGHMLFDNGCYDRAMGVLNAGLDLVAPSGMPNTYNRARILSDIGCIEMQQGQFEKSAAAFEQSKRAFLQSGAFESEEGAKLCSRYGSLLRKANDLEGAMVE